ncbi:MAG: type II toxin-antitoxin system Phd/YefM family antitoxin [Ignavibacteriales bacterium]|jgi:antitoxin (DNA-binding transcriptional repressor) of toxin-antitoxin stability system
MRIERKKVITAKELKNKTGAALRYVTRGGKVLVTMRGKPIALITHPDQSGAKEQSMLRTFDEAWKDIEEALKKTEPFFESWREAENWSRKRERKG